MLPQLALSSTRAAGSSEEPFAWISKHRRAVAALPVATMPSPPFQPHDKVPPIAQFAGQRPAVWIDDLHPAEAWAWSTGRREPTLLIPVASATGWTREAVDQALTWVGQT